MDIKESLQRILKTYQDNFGILFSATLIACILSCLSVGILAGPLLGGLLLYNLKLFRGEKVDLSLGLREIFGHFEQTLPCLLLLLIMGILWYISIIIGAVPVIGWLFNLAVNPLLFFLFCLALLNMMDHESDFIPALKRALGILLTNPLNIGLYGVIIVLLGMVGALFFVLPVVITIPFTFIGSALAYSELSSRAHETLYLPAFINKHTLPMVIGLIIILFLIGFTLKFGA